LLLHVALQDQILLMGNAYEITILPRYGGIAVAAVAFAVGIDAFRRQGNRLIDARVAGLSIGMAFACQFLVVLATVRSPDPGSPMAAWPFEALRQGLSWMFTEWR
jgi:hypothetical protein